MSIRNKIVREITLEVEYRQRMDTDLSLADNCLALIALSLDDLVIHAGSIAASLSAGRPDETDLPDATDRAIAAEPEEEDYAPGEDVPL